ncbi:hypothetical protein HED60_05755 [Planctomycetales bacterium ZRK34]|nr:hypothetical protein HED60_05755 [Planctomycetales bacterium ZRK34]
MNTTSEAATSEVKPHRYRAGFFTGLLTAFAAMIVITLVVAASGVVSVSAQGSFGPMDSFLGFASRRSIAFHAPTETNPYADDPKSIAEGLPHYRAMCVVCHGAPGLDAGEIAEGLNPPPPDLSAADTQKMTDGELFWVITNGIHSTGMPAFENADPPNTRWKIVSFVRHLPDLTPAERGQLGESREDHGREHSHADEHGHGAQGEAQHTHP